MKATKQGVRQPFELLKTVEISIAKPVPKESGRARDREFDEMTERNERLTQIFTVEHAAA